MSKASPGSKSTYSTPGKRATGSGADIYGSDPQGAADKITSDVMSQLKDAGKYVDINGVSDGRAKTDLEDK